VNCATGSQPVQMDAQLKFPTYYSCQR